jgi:hypothetical protein
MDDKDFNALEAEKKEIRLLISNGIKFVVEYADTVENKVPFWKKWLWWIKRKNTAKVSKQEEFFVKQPTAYTLDRLCAEYIELVIDEDKLKEAPRQMSRQYFRKYSRRMATIVAIAVLGNEWENDIELKRLSGFFFKWVKNSQLYELVKAIDLTNNLVDFVNSIRLMSGARTTIPDRIENKED